MIRAILSVVGGYAAMFVVLFSIFTAAYLALGAEGALKEGSFEPSTTWIAITFPVDVLAAVVGGFVCAKIAGRQGPVRALIVVVILLGALQVLGTMAAEDPGPRTAELSNIEAMSKTVMPTWVAIGHIVLGVAGITIGGRMGRKPEAA